MTADEYGRLPDLGYPTELVGGQIKMMNQPYPEHGEICLAVGALLRAVAKKQSWGELSATTAESLLAGSPDTVRGPDVAFYSYQRLPPGRLSKRRYLDVVPELAVEVKSDFDRWSEFNEKIAEYRQAGVLVVCVVDPETDTVQVHSANKPMRVVQRDEDLLLPEVLPKFRVIVRELFK